MPCGFIAFDGDKMVGVFSTENFEAAAYQYAAAMQLTTHQSPGQRRLWSCWTELGKPPIITGSSDAQKSPQPKPGAKLGPSRE